MTPGDAEFMKASCAPAWSFADKQIGNVLLQRRQILDLDLATNNRTMVLGCAAGIRQSFLVCREIVKIFRRGARHLGDFKASEAVTNIGGVTDLAHLAIADDVNAGVHLLGGHLTYSALHHEVEFNFVIRLSLVLRE